MFSCEIKLFVFSNSKFKIYNVIMYNVNWFLFFGYSFGSFLLQLQQYR